MRNVLIGLLAVAGLVIGYFVLVPRRADVGRDAGDYAVVAKSMGDFQARLAGVALDQLDHPTGLGIRPTDAEVPVGTLFQPGRSLVFDDSSCVPEKAPTPYRAGSTFPAYRVTGDAAASVGLGEGVLSDLVSAGAKVDRGRTIQIAFEDVQRAYLDDSRLRALISRPDCAAALAGGGLSIIRGYFVARRVIDIATTDTGAIKAGLRVGSFEVSRGAGDATVHLADDKPYGFLQLYTSVTPVAVAAAAPAPAPAGIPWPPATRPGAPAGGAEGGGAPPPSAAPVQGVAVRTARGLVRLQIGIAPAPAPTAASSGRVFVQRDVADTSGTADAVLAAYRDGGFPVAGRIEAVPSAKMPAAAQVRYFNAEDRARADTALAILRQRFPTAQLRRVPLPSPSGQLEVWLPKAG